MQNERVIPSSGASLPDSRTESGELERPELRRRKIDCGADPADRRRLPRDRERRNNGFAPSPTPEG
jgi:hypothetical protein